MDIATALTAPGPEVGARPDDLRHAVPGRAGHWGQELTTIDDVRMLLNKHHHFFPALFDDAAHRQGLAARA